MATSTLPPDFLKSRASDIKASPIDFGKVGLPLLDKSYAIVLDNVLSKEECAAFIEAAEATTQGKWDPAMVNIGGGRQVLAPETRSCGRIIWDSQEVADRLWSRVESLLPELALLEEWYSVTGRGKSSRFRWEFSRLNERMRILKYQDGDYFREHCDGNYADPKTQEISFFTLHLYLNDATTNKEGILKGGATTFVGDDMTQGYGVDPKVGRVLIFQQRGLFHCGEEVSGGTKMTLRTDMMYRRTGEVESRDK